MPPRPHGSHRRNIWRTGKSKPTPTSKLAATNPEQGGEALLAARDRIKNRRNIAAGGIAAVLAVVIAYGATVTGNSKDDAEAQRDSATQQVVSLADQIQAECAVGRLAGPICSNAARAKVDPTPGPRGPAGDIGASGPAGMPGEPGRGGGPGLTGPPGPEGDDGTPGSSGAPGSDGAAGSDGPPGAAGNDGDTITGPQGPTGPAGPAGPQGPAGPAGPVGPAGPAGPAGSGGPDGGTGTPGSPPAAWTFTDTTGTTYTCTRSNTDDTAPTYSCAPPAAEEGTG